MSESDESARGERLRRVMRSMWSRHTPTALRNQKAAATDTHHVDDASLMKGSLETVECPEGGKEEDGDGTVEKI